MSSTVTAPGRSAPDADGVVLRDAAAAHHARTRAGDRMHHLFEQACDRFGPEHPAVELADGSGVHTIGFGALDAQANRLAHYLIAHGVRAGDRVALLLDEPAVWYPAMLAVLKAGAAYVPLDAGYPRDRLAYILQDAAVTTVLTRSGLRPLVEAEGVAVVVLDELEAQLAELSGGRPAVQAPAIEGDDLAYIVYTSGSTGRPKGVAVEHASICNFVRVAAEVYGLRRGDRMYQGMTIAFDFSVEEIWVPWACGATLVPRPAGGSLLGADLHAFLLDRGVTAMACVPTLLATLPEDLPALRFLLVSGEACPYDLVLRWWREDRRFLNVYGPTEATVTATWTPVHPDHPVTIGVPLPTYSCVVLDPQTGEPLPRGGTGELAIAGIGLAVGYVNRPDLTAAAFVPDPIGLPDNPSGRLYRTGDLVRAREDGQIEYLGRIDLQVKIRGYRIELTEIESVLMQAPGVAQAVVTTHSPQPDVVELAGYVSRLPGVAELDLDAVVDQLRERLPAYMVPAYLDELDTIPLLPSDKADRKALPPPRARRTASRRGAPATAPRTPLERRLADLVGQVVGVPAVGADAHLFDDLGANSLLMARFCALVRAQDDLPTLSMRDVYLSPTVAGLARRAAELGAESALRASGLEAGEPAGPAASQPGGRVPGPRASRTAVTVVGTLQTALLLALLWASAAGAVLTYRFVVAAPDLFGSYLRAVVATALTAVVLTAVPVAAKWILVGRYRPREVRLWTADHLRFWFVARLQRLSPLSWYGGSPLQVAYLRLLGARIGPGALLLTGDLPVCTDLVRIGAGAVVGSDVTLRGYRPEAGLLRLGPVRVGDGAVVGDRCVLDIGTGLGAGARLAHGSSLQDGQYVPEGQTWHGSPARPRQTPLPDLPNLSNLSDLSDLPEVTGAAGRRRRTWYAAAQLAWLLLGWGPIVLAVVDTTLAGLGLDGSSGGVFAALDPQTAGDLVHPAFLGAAALAALVLGTARHTIGALGALVVPRVLAAALPAGVPMPVHGWRFAAARAVRRLTNRRIHMQLFGDSSYILGYLRVLGWAVDTSEQTGSNFGLAQRHESPYHVTVGAGTMVSDGLAVMNVEYSASAFTIRPTRIGDRCFLGNELVYPAGARLGDDVLLATKVAVPVDGPVHTGVGLLGSPAFVIPRSVARDDEAFPSLRLPGVRRQRIAAKNRHNLRTMAAFLLIGWTRLTLAVAVASAATLLGRGAVTTVFVAQLGLLVAALALGVGVERATLRMRPLQPRFVSIWQPTFWRHERYWKLSVSALLTPLAGTPLRPMLLRALGLRVGRAVYDDGCGIPERSLVTIGSGTSLAARTTIQGHSLEEGAFKSDRIVIGEDVTLGPGAFVHYGTTIGDGAVLHPDSFLMKGEQVGPGEHWVGNPAQPVESRPLPGTLAAQATSDPLGTLRAAGVEVLETLDGTVGVALVDLDALDPADVPAGLLDAADRQDVDRQPTPGGARRTATVRTLLRLLLSATADRPVDPAAWRLQPGRCGTLTAVGPHGPAFADVALAGRRVAIAVARRPVGLGLEVDLPTSAWGRLGWSGGLAAEHAAQVSAAPQAARTQVYLQLWTRELATGRVGGDPDGPPAEVVQWPLTLPDGAGWLSVATNSQPR